MLDSIVRCRCVCIKRVTAVDTGPDYHRLGPKALHILRAHFAVAHIDVAFVATIFLLESRLQFGC